MKKLTLSTLLITTLLTSASQASTDNVGNSFNDAKSVTINSVTNAAIDSTFDDDYFKISVPSRGTLTLNSSIGVGATVITNTQAFFYNELKQELSRNKDSLQDKNFYITRKVNPGIYYIKVTGQVWDKGAYKLHVNFKKDAPATKQKIVVLVHGMNSSPTTWSDLIDTSFVNGCQTITHTDLFDANNQNINSKFLPNSKAIDSDIACYNIKFGYFDVKGNRKGLEDVTCSDATTCKGDFSSVAELGIELEYMLNTINNVYANKTEITLLGHSRGGLAITSYLENPLWSGYGLARDNVKAVITTGTPHKGSPLGRTYQYMEQNCMPRNSPSLSADCKKDWSAFSDLLTFGGLDLRTPTINDLSPENAYVNSLANQSYKIPANIDTTQIVNVNTDLGKLQTFVNIWSTSGWAPVKISNSAKNAILQGADFNAQKGDGIVPEYSQKFGAKHTLIEKGKYHIKETKNPNLYLQLDAVYSRLNW